MEEAEADARCQRQAADHRSGKRERERDGRLATAGVSLPAALVSEDPVAFERLLERLVPMQGTHFCLLGSSAEHRDKSDAEDTTKDAATSASSADTKEVTVTYDYTDASMVYAHFVKRGFRFVSILEGGFDRVALRISKFNEVHSCYLMSGGYDLLVIVEGIDLRTVSAFVAEKLATMPGVISTATHFLLKPYKEHGILTSGEYSDEKLAVTP